MPHSCKSPGAAQLGLDPPPAAPTDHERGTRTSPLVAATATPNPRFVVCSLRVWSYLLGALPSMGLGHRADRAPRQSTKTDPPRPSKNTRRDHNVVVFGPVNLGVIKCASLNTYGSNIG